MCVYIYSSESVIRQISDYFFLKFLSFLQDVEELSMLIPAPSNLPITLRISQPMLNVPGLSSPTMETI